MYNDFSSAEQLAENKAGFGLQNNSRTLVLFPSNIIAEIDKVLYLAIKRFFDILLSSIGLILTLPLFLFIFLAIKLTSEGNFIYKHKRIGKDGKYIYLYKFRTMYCDADNMNKYFTPEQLAVFKKEYKYDNDPRITKVGRILRKTSLDELPQLLNIIKGDMSLIGPRPVVDGEIEKYGENKVKFLSVTPGLTGWWACNGRSSTTYEERIDLELYYVDHASILLDIICIFKTVKAVLKKEGAK